MTKMTEAQFNSIPEKDRMGRTLEGVAYWAFLNKPKHSEKYRSDTFIIQLGLDAANIAKAESYGLEVQPADKGVPMPYVTIQRKVREGKTFAETKPSVVDSMQKAVPESITVGNGSKVIVKFGTYWYDAVRTTLFKVQIRELVEFKASGDKGMVMDATGFTVGSTDVTPEFESNSEFDQD